MMNAIVIFFRLIFSNYRKLLLILTLTLVFLFLLFPLSDLNDLISNEVSRLTQNRVYFQFDKMHINPLTASLNLDNVLVETPQISNLTSDSVQISPSLMAAFQKKPGGTFVATGLLKGDVEVNITPTDGKTKIELNAQNISLSEAREIAQLNLPIKGQVTLTSQALTDYNLLDGSMTEQPEMDLNLSVLKFELPSTTITNHMLGSINIPQIQFDKVELKGRLTNGKFQIESGKLGTSKDPLYGDVKGEIGLSLTNINGQITPQFGSYNITVDLKANSDFQSRAQLFLSFLDASKTLQGSTAQYKFKLQGDMMNNSFQLNPVR